MKTAARKPHLNLSIDPNLLMLFEALKPIHGREYSEFMEEKLTSLLLEIAPDKLMELEIEKTKERLAELEGNLPSVKFAYNNIRALKKEEKGKKVDNEAEQLEQTRDRMYQKHLPNLKFQIKNNKPFDWSKLQEDLRFKNKFDVMDYVEGRLREEGLMR